MLLSAIHQEIEREASTAPPILICDDCPLKHVQRHIRFRVRDNSGMLQTPNAEVGGRFRIVETPLYFKRAYFEITVV